ncbi:MAG: chemotaxis protein CheW, partial [Dokdonella sp.]
REIRGLMVPVANGRLLLPNATVAEVLTYSAPERHENAPDWLLGAVAWRGWRVPLVSFSRISGIGREDNFSNTKIAVLKALGGDPKMPFIAVLTQGFPRLVTVSAESMVPTDEDGQRARGILAEVLVRDDPAIIPDLEAIEAMVVKAEDVI